MAVPEEEEKEEGETVEVWKVDVFLQVRELENEGTWMRVASIRTLALGIAFNSNAATSPSASALVS